MKFAAFGLTAFLIVGTALAHHSPIVFDRTKQVTLTGVVTEFRWGNPHSWIHVDVADADGKVANWNLELASPNYLKRAGWSSTSLKEGDEVTVEGSLARSGANMANARLVTFPDGTRVFARSAQDGG